MTRFITIVCLLFSIILYTGFSSAQEIREEWKPSWQMVADPAELKRTWESAVVRLPEKAGDKRGNFLRDESSLNKTIGQKLNGTKLPLVLYLHDCAGLGYHREDIANLSRLGFAVIAPDSFARSQRPMGCYEDLQQYLKYYDFAAALLQAELDYAINRIKALPWVDDQQLFLIGSGVGGAVVAQYQGAEFAGHVIEGWGCRPPPKAFDGIKTQSQIRIYSVVSRNDGWYKDGPGFGNECASLLRNRPGSISIILDDPAHYVSWYPGSRTPLIKFLTQDFDSNEEALNSLIDDTPIILEAIDNTIYIRVKWSVEGVYTYATEYCSKLGRKSYLIDNTIRRTYEFVCS